MSDSRYNVREVECYASEKRLGTTEAVHHYTQRARTYETFAQWRQNNPDGYDWLKLADLYRMRVSDFNLRHASRLAIAREVKGRTAREIWQEAETVAHYFGASLLSDEPFTLWVESAACNGAPTDRFRDFNDARMAKWTAQDNVDAQGGVGSTVRFSVRKLVNGHWVPVDAEKAEVHPSGGWYYRSLQKQH